tara:strand:- start:31 stop:579 length:549 start_codon:yes stop_codon:yes gene_type:complete
MLEYLADGSWKPICTKVFPGDRLYVREAHYLTDDGTTEYAIFAEEAADVTAHREEIEDLQIRQPQIDWSKHLRLRPSIHMPRWASRLTLTVTDVRVQRLQDISEADAIAEGIERSTEHPNCWKRGKLTGDQNFVTVTGFPKLAFRSIWESINGADAWDANPWIYAISFDVQLGNIDTLKLPE